VLRLFLVRFWRPASSARLHVKLCLHLTFSGDPLWGYLYILWYDTPHW
jgi:hypothetical protein